MAAPLTHLARRLFSPVALAILILSFASSSANAAFFNLLRQHMTFADLRIDSFALDKREAGIGETLRATVIISNSGMLGASASVLTFWTAAGSTSSMSGASRVAAVQLGALAPKSGLTHVSTLPVPSDVGTYQIFAILETPTRESNLQNNTRVATLQIIAPSDQSSASDSSVADSSSPGSSSSGSDSSPSDSSSSSGSSSSGSSSPPSTPPPVESSPNAPCDYYASPNGTGTGLSSSSPFAISRFWPVATPGKTLCLMDGTYQGSASMIAPPSGLSGTNGNPITIRALNEGGVTIDGQFERTPIHFQSSSWWVIEGINARSGIDAVFRFYGSPNNNVFRRMVLWDSHIGKNITTISAEYTSSTNNLFEDIAVFGTGRKNFVGGGGAVGNTWTVRRGWFRWEGTTYPGSVGVSTNYDSFGFTCENCIMTWTGDSMPESYEVTDAGGNGTGRFRSNLQIDAGPPLTTDGQRSVSECANVKVLGSFVFLPASTTASFDFFSIITHGSTSCVSFRHVFAYVSPNNPRFHDVRGWYLVNSGDSPTNVSAHNITSVRSARIGDTFESPWDIQNLSAGTSLPAVANPWTTTGAGANLCKRWVNGAVTNEPLWPWPMNDRIKAATASAGAYSGPCLNCVGGRRTRTATDVTADVEALLGPIPSNCRANP